MLFVMDLETVGTCCERNRVGLIDRIAVRMDIDDGAIVSVIVIGVVEIFGAATGLRGEGIIENAAAGVSTAAVTIATTATTTATAATYLATATAATAATGWGRGRGRGGVWSSGRGVDVA